MDLELSGRRAVITGGSRGIGLAVARVLAAARPNTGRAHPMGDDDLPDEINIKVYGYLRCIRALAPGMTDRGWGRVINIAGLAARWTGSVVGSVRNVAVVAMTKNLADEYGPLGLTVNVVHPGMTLTERTPDTLAGMAAARGGQRGTIHY